MRSVIGFGIAAFAIAVAAFPAAATEKLVNGNFEATGFGGTSTYYNLGTVGADNAVPADFGFTVPVNNVDLIANGVYTPSLVGGGAYNLDLVGYGATGSISQTFGTTVGFTYIVTLAYTQNGSGKVADVTVDGVSIGTLNASGSWQTFTSSFAGTGASVVFAVTETVGGGSGGVVLDNLSVNAVPEPATWTMLIAGFGLVGVAARRRVRLAA